MNLYQPTPTQRAPAGSVRIAERILVRCDYSTAQRGPDAVHGILPTADAHTAVSLQCVLADVGRGVVDAKRQWRRDQTLTLKRLRRRRLGQLMTWIIPGFVAMTEGRPVRGMIANGLFYACLILILDLHVLAEEVYHVGGPSAARTIPLITIAVIVYVVSLVRVHRQRGTA